MVMAVARPPPISGSSWDGSPDDNQAGQREGRRYETMILVLSLGPRTRSRICAGLACG